MRHLLSAATLIALFLSAAFAFAQDDEHSFPPPPEDAYLDAMAGSWTGTGTMMGMSMTERLESGWELGHQFFVGRSNTTVTMPDGSTLELQAVMMYKPAGDGTYAGFYFDSTGSAGPFTARLTDGQMTVEWLDPHHGTSNRSLQVMNEDGSVNAAMTTQQPDGTWADSGAMVYTRAE